MSKKISALDTSTPLVGDELVAVVKNGTTGKTTIQDVADFSTVAAVNITYDNSTSGLAATTVKLALDELKSDADALSVPDQSVNIAASPTFAGLNVDGNTFYVDDGSDRVSINSNSPTSTFDVNGSISHALVTVTSNTTLNVTHSSVFCDSTSGDLTITLPTAGGCNGRIYIVKKIVANNKVTIDTFGAETIEGNDDAIISIKSTSLKIQSDGTNWYII